MLGITKSGVSEFSITNSDCVAIDFVRGSSLSCGMGVSSFTIFLLGVLIIVFTSLDVVWFSVILLETSDQENWRVPTVFLRGSWLPCESRYLIKSGSQLCGMLIGGNYYFSLNSSFLFNCYPAYKLPPTSCTLLLRSCIFLYPTYLCSTFETSCFPPAVWRKEYFSMFAGFVWLKIF